MSIKTIAVFLVIASYLMNGDTSADLHFLHLLVFSALQDELIVERNNHFFQSCTKQAPRFETSVEVSCSPGSHRHSSVECTFSALIDSEAHDPVSKVKGRLLLLKQAGQQSSSSSLTQNYPSKDCLNSSASSNSLWRVSNESDSTSGVFQLWWNTDKAATSVHIRGPI